MSSANTTNDPVAAAAVSVVAASATPPPPPLTIAVAKPFSPDDDDAPVAFPDVPPTPTETTLPVHPGRLRRPSKTPDTVKPDDEVIPTAIVIKNIPFAMKRDQLIQIIDDLRLPQPYALNYHFENGAFRGLAFANFRSSQEAEMVVKGLHGFTALGRDIRVEYKKVLPAEEAARKEAERRASILALDDRVPEFDLSDPATRALYEKMVHFRDDKSRYELIFAKTITGPERKLVRAIGQRLGFFYRTEDNGEERFFKVARKPTTMTIPETKGPRKYSLLGQNSGYTSVPPPLGIPTVAGITNSGVTPTLGTGIPAGLAIPDHRVPVAVATLRAAEGAAAAARIRAYSMGTPETLSVSARPAFRKNSMMSGAPPPGFTGGSATPPPGVTPATAVRQPKGPDAVTGFRARTVSASLNPTAAPFNVQEVQAAVAAATAQKKALEIVDPLTKETVVKPATEAPVAIV